jgi:uncharacterized protein (DUF849 family)
MELLGVIMPTSKTYYSLAGLVITAYLLSACSKQISVDDEGGVTTQQDSLVIQETTYEKDQTKFLFRKNRVTKTAEVEMTHAVTDADEYSEFFGEQMTTAPFLINMICGIMNQAFYNPDYAQTLAEDNKEAVDNLKNDSEIKNALADYTVSNYKLNFIDAENQQAIASCQATQLGFENIQFSVQRDYSEHASFMGIEIGKTE